MAAKYIAAFRVVPKELFRVNNGLSIRLREGTPQRILQKSKSYDILTYAGRVLPKAQNPTTYEAPNGASMRPNTSFQQRLVKTFKAADVLVYSIPVGTPLPDHLVLVHERGDHYSLQAAVEMPLAELNEKITAFLSAHGNVRTKEEWLAAYPQATE